MIESDLAELVHQYEAARHPRIAQHAVEQRGLATAKKARDQADGHALGRLVLIEQTHCTTGVSSVTVYAMRACILTLAGSGRTLLPSITNGGSVMDTRYLHDKEELKQSAQTV